MKILGALIALAIGISLPSQAEAKKSGAIKRTAKLMWKAMNTEQARDVPYGPADGSATGQRVETQNCMSSTWPVKCTQGVPWKVAYPPAN